MTCLSFTEPCFEFFVCFASFIKVHSLCVRVTPRQSMKDQTPPIQIPKLQCSAHALALCGPNTTQGPCRSPVMFEALFVNLTLSCHRVQENTVLALLRSFRCPRMKLCNFKHGRFGSRLCTLHVFPPLRNGFHCNNMMHLILRVGLFKRRDFPPQMAHQRSTSSPSFTHLARSITFLKHLFPLPPEREMPPENEMPLSEQYDRLIDCLEANVSLI